MFGSPVSYSDWAHCSQKRVRKSHKGVSTFKRERGMVVIKKMKRSLHFLLSFSKVVCCCRGGRRRSSNDTNEFFVMNRLFRADHDKVITRRLYQRLILCSLA